MLALKKTLEVTPGSDRPIVTPDFLQVSRETTSVGTTNYDQLTAKVGADKYGDNVLTVQTHSTSAPEGSTSRYADFGEGMTLVYDTSATDTQAALAGLTAHPDTLPKSYPNYGGTTLGGKDIGGGSEYRISGFPNALSVEDVASYNPTEQQVAEQVAEDFQHGANGLRDDIDRIAASK